MEFTKVLTVPKVGRPSVINEQCVAKLCDAFKLGLNTQTACQYAKIDRSTFYRNYEKDPSFASKIDDSRDYLLIVSMSIIYDQIVNKNNVRVSMWYLDRKRYFERDRLEAMQNSTITDQNEITAKSSWLDRILND